MKSSNYISVLKDRAAQSRVYQKFQFTGLLIAEILNDEKHKSLYIKLAKKHDQDKLLALAREVAERKSAKNKGAYFMRMMQIRKLNRKNKNRDYNRNGKRR